jgi:O-antigen/teichoic acid export membrane protein
MWSSIRRDVAMFAAGNAGVLASQLIFRSILVVALTPVDYGRLSLVLSIYNTAWIVGASGVPSAVARHIALISPADDRAVLRAALRAALAPVCVAAVAVAIAAALVLHSLAAGALAAAGLGSLVYGLLMMGVLRGRGRSGLAALVMPVTALGELLPLVLLVALGVTVSMTGAFAVFCLGNVIGLAVAALLVRRSFPPRAPSGSTALAAPSPRQLLGFSMWLAAATLSVASLPLVLRSAAALDSYSTVALVDVALLLLALPQRLGTVILFAIVPHAARAIRRGERTLAVSRREHLLVIPFALAAIVLLVTPLARTLFDFTHRSAYAGSGTYLALALLAGPARIFYGSVEGVLIAHGDGRFLAAATASVALVGSIAVLGAVAVLHSVTLAFVVFVAALWAIYLVGLARTRRLAASV